MASNMIKIYIGRDVDCNYRISSIEISRKHALLEYCSQQHFWSISDLNSTNGLFVNSVQLQAFSPYRLVSGDKVSFGPPNQSQFCYQFVDNSPVYELHGFHTIGVTSIPLVPVVTREQTNSPSGLVNVQASAMPTRSGLEYAVTTTRAQRTIAAAPVSIVAKKVMTRKASADSTGRQTFGEHDYSLNSSSTEKNRKSVSRRLKLKASLENKAKALRMESERKYIAEEKKKLEKSKKSLERKKNMDQLKMKRKEEALRKKQKELERKEQEAKKREEEIEKLRKDLMKEKKMLAEKKQQDIKPDSGAAKRKLRSSSVRDLETNESKRQCKEDKKVMEDLLESELTCSICSEYFIQAVNLNCSHTYCEQCIEEWKRTNSDEAVCPICRHPIENQNRELVLDNLIDQFIAQTKPSLVEHRKKVAEERKKKLAKKVSHNRGGASSARERLTRLIPSLQFFLRSATGNSSSDSETDDLSIININMDDFENSSSSNSSWSDSSDSDSDDSSDDSSSSSSSEDSVASSQNSIASVRSVRSDHNYIDIDISSLYSTAASLGSANASNDSHFSDSDSDVESVVSIHSNNNRIEIEINSNDSDDSDDSDFSVDD